MGLLNYSWHMYCVHFYSTTQEENYLSIVLIMVLVIDYLGGMYIDIDDCQSGNVITFASFDKVKSTTWLVPKPEMNFTIPLFLYENLC